MALGGAESVGRIVAVLGCQRSGTTLIGGLLGAHPNAFLIDEYDGLYGWFEAQAGGRREADDLFSAMVARAAGKYACPGTRMSVADGGTLAAAVTHLVLKAPNLTYDREALARLPVPVSVIYPVRDPRAVVLSMSRLNNIDFIGNQLKLLDRHPDVIAAFPAERDHLADGELSPAARQATIWRLKSDLAGWHESAGLPVCQFRYEDLVDSPTKILARVAGSAQLAFHPLMAEPAGVYVGEGPGGTDRTRPIDRHSAQRWRTELEERAEAEILAFAGPAAAKFDYRPTAAAGARRRG